MISYMQMEKEILNLIKTSLRILIITHVNPDGDTLGTASALKSYIGEKADILIQVNDKSLYPKMYEFLPHINSALNFSNVKNEYDLAIAVDVASIDRMIGNARKIFENAKNTIVIDHHKTNKGYGKINYIKGSLSSASEVLYDLFYQEKKEITEEMAKGLYCGILTDTGCFKYENTTPKTFKIASELANCNINTSEIADFCYSNKPKNLILFQNYLVSNAKFRLNDKIAYTLITKEIISKFQATDEFTEGICETLRSIAGVEIAFVLKETDLGIKVSIRSKNLDATKITDKFNGGGHRRAAGCTIKLKNINEALEKLIKQAETLL